MIDLRYMDVRHFVIIDCCHLANGCKSKSGSLGLMLVRYVSRRGL